MGSSGLLLLFVRRGVRPDRMGPAMTRRIAQLAGLGLAALLLAGCSGQQCQGAGQLQLERAAVIVPAAPPPAPRPPAPAPRPPAPAPRPPAPARQAPAPARPPAPAAPRQQQAPAPIIVHQDSGPSPWLWWWMISQQDNEPQQCSKDG